MGFQWFPYYFRGSRTLQVRTWKIGLGVDFELGLLGSIFLFYDVSTVKIWSQSHAYNLLNVLNNWRRIFIDFVTNPWIS